METKTYTLTDLKPECINKPLVSFGYFVSFRTMDKGVVEMFGPYGAVNTFSGLMKSTSKLQTGYIYHYAFTMIVGVCVLMSLWLYRT